jgi:hypothetical protein
VSSEGRVGITLSKQGVDYKAWVDFSGRMALAKVNNERETILIQKEVDAPPAAAFTLVKFANVDHQLLFEFNGNELFWDLGESPDALEQGQEQSPRAEVFGSGKLTLSHIALFRDTYYTGDGQGSRTARAIEGKPFTLNQDEFFVLGDNSPNSEDGRWWGEPGVASKGWDPPRAGVVPRYYLVGRALFVYWPSGFEFPWPRSVKSLLLNNSRRNMAMRLLHGLVTLRWIPNVGQMRFIHGGTYTRTGLPQPPSEHVADTAPKATAKGETGSTAYIR